MKRIMFAETSLAVIDVMDDANVFQIILTKYNNKIIPMISITTVIVTITILI